jgi:DUF1365 family protein
MVVKELTEPVARASWQARAVSSFAISILQIDCRTAATKVVEGVVEEAFSILRRSVLFASESNQKAFNRDEAGGRTRQALETIE